MNLDLFSFDKNDKLKNYVFESEWIKQFSLETNEVFKFKGILKIERKPKKDKLFFIVNEDFIHTDNDLSGGNCMEFKEEKSAIDSFIDRVEELKFFIEQNKDNKVFDGQRYFWRINEKDEVIERI